MIFSFLEKHIPNFDNIEELISYKVEKYIKHLRSRNSNVENETLIEMLWALWVVNNVPKYSEINDHEKRDRFELLTELVRMKKRVSIKEVFEDIYFIETGKQYEGKHFKYKAG